MIVLTVISYILFTITLCTAQVCQFHLSGDNKLFEKAAENLPVGGQIAKVRVHPRTFFAIEATDDKEDIEYVKFMEVDDQHIALIVAKSLEDLVDQAQPKSVLKFKLACRGSNDSEVVYLPVNIYIQDINDHSPIFQNAPYFIEVDELTPVGLTIFKGIRATDGDKPNTANSEVSYSIVGGNVGDTFILSDPMEGNVVVAKPLDYDAGIREYKLDIQVQDHGSPVSHSSVTTLHIKVKDSDDQNPAFTSDVYKVKVEEKWQLTGATIRERLIVEPPIHAEDTDKGINASVRYSILAGNEAEYFSLDAIEGVLYLLKEIDREQLMDNLFVLQIQAAQQDNPIRLTKARIEVEIVDLNDNLPIFEVDLYNVSIMENLPNGFSVAQVRAIDEDQGDNAAFRFQLEDPVDAFQIDPVSGWITVKNQTRLDSEKQTRLDLKVFAIEKTRSVLGISEPSSTQVEVYLIDTNDNDPVFLPSSVYRFNVSETAPGGTIIGSVRAVDGDSGENGHVFYFKHGDTSNVPFDVHRENGSIFVTQSPASMNSKSGEFVLFVGAADKPHDPSERRSSLAIVYVQTEDENNNPPTFLGMPLSAQVGENLPMGTVVTTVMAKDPDSKSLLRFSLENKNGTLPFRIDAQTGVVTTLAALDFEAVEAYQVDITVTDGDFIVTAPLLVHVIDVNDHIPRFEKSHYQFSVVEEEEPGLIIGSVRASDVEKGQNGEIRYDVIETTGNPAFAITENGTVYTIRPIDRESESSFDITVVASDQGVPSLSGTASVHVQVEDINDNLPQFITLNVVASVQEELSPPVTLATVSATDADSGANANVLYYIVSGNEDGQFNINRTTGVVTAQRPLDFERRQRHVLNVSAVDREEHEGNPVTDWTKSFVQVIINVEDRHDSAPTFDRDDYTFVISEDHKPFEIAAVVNAYNTSSPYEQKIIYWMDPGHDKLKLDSDSGEVILIEPVDRDPPSNQVLFKVQVFARDILSISQKNSSTNVTILVSDVNDNDPKFEQNFYQVQIPEDTPLGSNLPITFNTQDPDEGPNGRVALFTFNQTHPKFLMNNATGVVTLIEPLDYEDENRYTFEVLAVDAGDPPRTGSTTLVVNILNINESPPVFANATYEFWAGENVGRGTQVGQVTAMDADANSVLYSLVRGDLDYFDIDETSGKVYTKADTSGRSLYHLVAMAIDDGQPKPLSSTAELTIHVKEANNHPPVFTQPVYEASVPEKDASGNVVAQVSARDEDPLNNNVTYSIAEGNDENVFMIDQLTGEIRVHPDNVQRLDYDVKSAYTLVVEAKDSHERPRIGVAMVQITVDDINDHPPKFTKNDYHSAVRENLADTFCFLQVKAESGDSVDQVRYSLVGAAHSFAVDGASGQVCVVKSLDREAQAQYTLTVKATDNRFNSFATINVEVVDENDNSPQFQMDQYEVTIPRDAKPGSEVITVKAEDPDTLYNGQVTYWTTNNYGLFEMDYKTGTIKLLQGFPHNSTGDRIYVLELFAQDHGMDPKTGRAELIVKVSADGGHKPVFDKFVYHVTLPEREENLTVTTVHATDPDPGEQNRVRYRIKREIGARGVVDEDNAFDVDPVTGQIILEAPLDFGDSRFHQVEVEAFDEGEELTSSSTIVQVKVININNHAPHFHPIPSVVRLPASAAIGSTVFKVQAVDEDDPKGTSTHIMYLSSSPRDFFGLDPMTGDIVVAQKLRPVVQNLSIVASDQGIPPLENEMALVVHVYDPESPEMAKYPIFTTNQIFREYDEVLVPGTPIARVQAKAADDSQVSYNVTDGIGFQSFGIDSETGIIYTKKDIERGLYHLLISAYNKQLPSAFSECILTIKSTAPTTKCPVFIFPEFRASVSESTPPGVIVMNDLQVEGPEQFTKLQYKIVQDSSDGAFGLRSAGDNAAQVVLVQEVDREKMDVKIQGIYRLVISVASDTCESNATLDVFVEDVNDNAPAFILEEYSASVKENSASGTPVVKVSATDVDDLDSGRLMYSILDGNDDGYFELDQRSGQLVVKTPCDREVTSSFELVLGVKDTAEHMSRVNVFIEVLDKNDEKPKFENDSYILVTKEGSASLKASLVLEAIDGDIGENAQLEYVILKGNEEGEFAMTTAANKGVLSVVQELDRDAYETDAAAIRFLVVGVHDKGSPSLSATAMVTVVVEDINDQPAEFLHDHYHQLVSEGVNIGHNVTRVQATDRDSAENTKLVYSMRAEDQQEELPFEIESETGVISVSKLLDFADKNEYNITLFVSDGVHVTTSNLKVYVSEAIDRQPRTDRSHFDFRVEENKAGERVGQVVMGRPRDNLRRPIDYKILSADAEEFFAISSDGTLFTKVSLDREKRETYSFTVVQEDQKLAGRKDVCQVNIIVEDVNDEAPKFPSSYTGSINENCDGGTAVNITPAISAVDADSGLNSVFRFSLVGAGADLFEIDALQGAVYFTSDVNKSLDREEISEYHLQVVATDVFNLSSATDLTIFVTDLNDHSPIFTHGDQSVEILETTPVGTRVAKVIAKDEDAPGPNSDIAYSIASPFRDFFRVDEKSGEIFSNGVVTPETIFALNVSAMDGGGRSSYASVHVHVLDVNNHAPKFARPDYRFEVPEGRYTLHPHTLVTLVAKDADHGINAAIQYRLDSVNDEGWPFVVDASTGQLNITRDLDRETQASYNFVVTAFDQGVPKLSSSTTILVNVLDVNDEQPRFIGDPYYASVPENQKPGYFVAQVRAYDLDSNATGNGRIFYKLEENTKRTFFIDSTDGTIWTLASLDYETESSYVLQVTAYDRGIPSLSSIATVYVNVTDKDDLLPNFRKSVFMVEVAENAPPGSVVYKLDAGSPKFHYSIIDEELDETFSLDEMTGEVTLLRHLDSERQSRYKMRVLAMDQTQSGQNDTAQVILLVSTGPALRTFPKRNYQIKVRENLPAPLPILDLNATDESENNKIDYSILGDDFSGLFNLDSSSGRLTLTKSLDREIKDKYVIKVRGRKLGIQSTKEFMDHKSLDELASDEALVTLTVEDENDNAPEFGTRGRPLVTIVPVHASFGYHITTIKAVDGDSGANGQVRYEMMSSQDLSSRFQIDPTSGVLRALTPLALDAGKVFALDIRASDRLGATDGRSSYLNVMIYVVPDNKLVLLELGEKPLTVEANLPLILGKLSNVTGYDVKSSKIEPHLLDESVEDVTTELYVYGVDPTTNTLVDTQRFARTLNDHREALDRSLNTWNPGKVEAVTFTYKSAQMSATEVALLAFGIVVFIAACLGVFLACFRHRNRKSSAGSSPSKTGLSSPLWATEPKGYGHSLSGRGSRNTSMGKANYSSTIHSNPDYTTDKESPRDSYKDSLSSVSTLDLQKARRNRQRAPSNNSVAPPPIEDDVPKSKMNNEWPPDADLERSMVSDYPISESSHDKNWWNHKPSESSGIWLSMSDERIRGTDT